MSTLAVEPLTVANAASGLPTLVAFPGTTREPEVKPAALVRPASELLKTQVPPWKLQKLQCCWSTAWHFAQQ